MLDVLFEDDWMLALNKPFGMVVNRAESVTETTVQDAIEVRHGATVDFETDETFMKRSGMVHRLDKDTSGILLWALTPKAMFGMMNQFKKRIVKKTYMALVYGDVHPSRGDIRLPLSRHPKDRRRRTVDPDGKPAETRYTVLKKAAYDGTVYSLVLLSPVTGRTHQLRVHMKWLGYPLVGDRLYAGDRLLVRSKMLSQRLCLHAKEIKLTHPIHNETLSFTAPLDIKMTRTFQNLGMDEYV